MADVDERTAELVRSRSELLKTVPPPDRSRADLRGINDPVARATTPSSTNPRANELTFRPADEARDVAQRLAGYRRVEGQVVELALNDALRQAQLTGRELLNAEEEYILAAINVLLERHLWDPRFFATISPQIVARNSTGSPATTAFNVVSELRATQRLPWGGSVEASYVFALTDQLRYFATERYVSASSLAVNANIPLLRGAGDIAREDLIQAERNLVYAARTFENFRRSYLVSITRDYLQLVQQQQSIRNQQNAIELLQWLVNRTRALVEAGFLAEFQLNIANSDLLRATSTLARLQESYLLAADRFKIRLGLPVDQTITVKTDTPLIPEPQVTPAEATELALEYRLDLQTQRDQVDDARRGVRNAKNLLLPDLNVFASANLNRGVRRAQDVALVSPDPASYAAGVTFGLPLDRETERLGLRASTIALQQQERTYEQARDNVVVEARSRVREIDRTRFALQLAEESVKINLRRRQEQEVKADEVTAQQVVDTANALRDAENARDQALVDLRLAVLDYLLSTGQLRVSRDGTLEPIPGMPPPQPPPSTETPPPSMLPAGSAPGTPPLVPGQPPAMPAEPEAPGLPAPAPAPAPTGAG